MNRVTQWHRHYCWLPTQMRNGSWLWLDTCWRRMERIGPTFRFDYSDSVSPPDDVRTAYRKYKEATTPPPPKMGA